jgi:nitrite reductase/ring-hydroxylating ferredoxin subunit
MNTPREPITPATPTATSALTRRAIVTVGGVTVMGAGALVLAACSSPGSGGSAGGSGGSAGGSGGKSVSGTISIPAGTEVVKLADIPVGGTAAATVDGNAVLLAQPTAGSIVCFSAVCTHAGCTVGYQGGQLVCPCHGGVFDAHTGQVIIVGSAAEPVQGSPQPVHVWTLTSATWRQLG